MVGISAAQRSPSSSDPLDPDQSRTGTGFWSPFSLTCHHAVARPKWELQTFPESWWCIPEMWI
jgi:hypothetical protein